MDIGKLILNVTWKSKRLMISNTILKKNKVEESELVHFKTYYDVT